MSSERKRKDPYGGKAGRRDKRRKHSHRSSSKSSKHSKLLEISFIPDINDESGEATKKKRSEFLCDVVYGNVVPDPPQDPKLLRIHMPEERLLKLASASLEKESDPFLFDDYFCGIDLDLIEMEKYDGPPGVDPGDIHPDDEELLLELTEAEIAEGGHSANARKRYEQQLRARRMSRVKRESKSFLHRLTYTSNDLSAKSGDFTSMAEEKEARLVMIGKTKKVVPREITAGKIDKTFSYSHITPVHPFNKALTVEEIIPILPDLDLMEKNLSLVIYNQPLKTRLPQPATNSTLLSYSQQHHGLYLPKNGDLNSRQLVWQREFTKNPAPPVDSMNNFLMFRSGDSMRYCRFDRRLHLKMRSRKTNADPKAEVDIKSRPALLALLDPEEVEKKSVSQPSRVEDEEKLEGGNGDEGVREEGNVVGSEHQAEDAGNAEDKAVDNVGEEAAPEAGNEAGQDAVGVEAKSVDSEGSKPIL